jgi:uncharacterized spore protein YtfJ
MLVNEAAVKLISRCKRNDELSVIPLTNRDSLEKIVEMVPEILSKVDGYKPGAGSGSCCSD